ncbi:MAG: condensation domain-containing protein, partial [Hyphomicrobiaceae bacterium]
MKTKNKNDIACKDTRHAPTLPLTSTQERFWFLDQLRPGDPSLNVAIRWELRGCVPAPLIERAFQIVISRHEALRSRFSQRDGVPEQTVLDMAELRICELDLRDHDEPAATTALEDSAADFTALPFDLACPPLIRIKLAHLADDRAILLIVAHHIVFDGYSIGVLGNEFGIILDALLRGTAPSLPDLPLQMGDFALWQHEYLASDAMREDGEYWKTQLSDMGYFELPADRHRSAVRGTAVGYAHVDLPVSFGERLEQTAKRARLSAFAFGVAVLSMALHRATGSREVVFGTQAAGRIDIDLEGLIGAFINDLVLRLPTPPGTRLETHFETVRTIVADALLHQNMPFNRLVAALRPTRDLSRNPLVSMNFNLQRNTFLQNRTYERFELISRPSRAAGVIFDFNFLLIGRPDGWRLAVEYNSDLFDAETAEHLLSLVKSCFEEAFDARYRGLESNTVQLSGSDRHDGARKTRSGSKAVVGSAGPADVAERRRDMEWRPAPSLDDQGPRTDCDLHRKIADIWAGLLGIPAEACNGNFFELGGHSLLAMRMLARVESIFH